MLAEAGTGAVIEAHQGGLALPPASVGKILTALYALDRLGPGRRFETRLRAGRARWRWSAAATRCSTPTVSPTCWPRRA